MLGVGEGSESGFKVLPTPDVVEPAADQLDDERTALALAGTTIEFSNEVVIE